LKNHIVYLFFKDIDTEIREYISVFSVPFVYCFISVTAAARVIARLRAAHSKARFVPPAHRIADNTLLIQSTFNGSIQ